MSEHIDELCNRIASAIRDDDDPSDIFHALCALYTFNMSLLTCPHCRKQAAHALKKSIPEMLANANREAAKHASENPTQQPMTCH